MKMTSKMVDVKPDATEEEKEAAAKKKAKSEEEAFFMLDHFPHTPDAESGCILHPLIDQYSYLLNEQMPLFLNVNSIKEAWEFLDF